MKGLIKAIAFAWLLAATGAQAADLGAPSVGGGYKDEPVASDAWWNAGDIFVRVRGEALIPQTSTGSWNPGKLAGTSVVRSPDLSVDTVFLPELDLSYFLTKNLAVELICCVDRAFIGTAGSLTAAGPKVGDTWMFPPTLLLQYHFDGLGAFKPYVGGGVNYTVFFDEGSSGIFRNLKLDNAWGGAVQAGFDYHLQGNWFLNVDFKKLWLGTDFKVDALSSRVTGHVDLDPIIVGAGIGYRFGTAYTPLK